MIKKTYEIIRATLAVVGLAYIIYEFRLEKIVAFIYISALIYFYGLLKADIPENNYFKLYKKHGFKKIKNLIKLEVKK